MIEFKYRETMEVTYFLSLLEGCSFRVRRRDVCAWSPNLSQGFMCKSLFNLLLNPSPSRESVFNVVWRIKVSKKVRFFIWQVLLGQDNTMDRLVKMREYALLGLFVACFVERQRKTLTISFGTARCVLCGVFFCRSLAKSIHSTIEEFLLHPPFREKGFLLRGMIGCFVVGRGTIARFGL